MDGWGGLWTAPGAAPLHPHPGRILGSGPATGCWLTGLPAPYQAPKASLCPSKADGPRTVVRALETNLTRGRRPQGSSSPLRALCGLRKGIEKGNRSRAEGSEGEKDKRKGKDSEVRESCEWHLGNKAPTALPPAPPSSIILWAW